MSPTSAIVIPVTGGKMCAGKAGGWLLGALAVAAAGAALGWQWRDRSLARLQGGETLRVGYAVEAPYAFLTTDGRVTGEGPETARKVAARLGLGEPEWVLTDFGLLLEQLEAGRFDVIAAGLFITEERARRVAFSRETSRVPPGLLVGRGNPRRLHSYADAVADGEARLAALAGSVEEAALKAAGMPDARLTAVPDTSAGLALLLAGRVDGLALSQPTVKWMAGREDCRERVEPAGRFTPPAGAAPGRVAFAFRPADRRLREAWNRELEKVLSEEKHRRMLRELGFLETEGAR